MVAGEQGQRTKTKLRPEPPLPAVRLGGGTAAPQSSLSCVDPGCFETTAAWPQDETPIQGPTNTYGSKTNK